MRDQHAKLDLARMQQRETAVKLQDTQDSKLLDRSLETTFGHDVAIRPIQLKLKSDEQLRHYVRTVTDRRSI